jgi:hypothetical protein
LGVGNERLSSAQNLRSQRWKRNIKRRHLKLHIETTVIKVLMSGFPHSLSLKGSVTHLLLWILVWFGTFGSTPNLFGQQTQIVIHPLPDGNFRLSASPTLGTAIVVEFKKQGETVEGGGYHIVCLITHFSCAAFRKPRSLPTRPSVKGW